MNWVKGLSISLKKCVMDVSQGLLWKICGLCLIFIEKGNNSNFNFRQ